MLVANEQYPFTIVLGTSMEPTILPGSVAMIEKVPFNQLKVGDIIVFVPQEALLTSCDSTPTNSLVRETPVPCYVIHRIAKITYGPTGSETLETKGDNNGISLNFIDTGINSSMYIGKVVLQFPIAGYITVSPYNEIIAAMILVSLGGELLYERRQNQQKKLIPIQPEQQGEASDSPLSKSEDKSESPNT